MKSECASYLDASCYHLGGIFVCCTLRRTRGWPIYWSMMRIASCANSPDFEDYSYYEMFIIYHLRQ